MSARQNIFDKNSAQQHSTLSAKTTPIRLAIVGFGLVGRRHAEAVGHADGAILCAVVDPDGQARSEASQLSVPCYSALGDMISAEQPDGIILATPTTLHVEQALQCIDAGIAVLVEKPLADDLQEAQGLVERAEAKSVALMVGHHRRFNPLIQQAHTQIQQGRIGDIRAVHATCWFYKPDNYFTSAPWRARQGAGPVSVNLVHDIDLIRHLCGEITEIQARSAPSRRGYENEDVGVALLQFAGGALGTVTVSDSIVAPWSWEFTSREHPFYPFTAQSSYQIGGSHGALSVPDLSLWTHDNEPDWWTAMSAEQISFEMSDPLLNQINHFVDVIHGRTSPLVSGREGLRTLAVIDAIQIAARTGQKVQLDNRFGSEKLAEITRDSDPTESNKPEKTKLAL